MPVLSAEEKARYARQIMLPPIGPGGQLKLKAARVCIAGVGGLGTVCAYYMVAAGVGHLRIIDKDRVKWTDLNRQIIHGTDDLERPKVLSAREKLLRLNSHCRVEALEAEIREDTAMDLVSGCTVVLDATDNLPARRLLNRACVESGIPLVIGGVEGFDG